MRARSVCTQTACVQTVSTVSFFCPTSVSVHVQYIYTYTVRVRTVCFCMFSACACAQCAHAISFRVDMVQSVFLLFNASYFAHSLCAARSVCTQTACVQTMSNVSFFCPTSLSVHVQYIYIHIYIYICIQYVCAQCAFASSLRVNMVQCGFLLSNVR